MNQTKVFSHETLVYPSKLNSLSKLSLAWRFRSFFLRSYSSIIYQGLKQGLTLSDISYMRVKKTFFTTPVTRNTLLLKLHIKLRLLKTCSRLFFHNEKLTQNFQFILSRYEESCVSRWNPAIKSVERLTQDRHTEESEYQMQLYVIPSPYGFDWSSPRKFLASWKNYLTPFFSHKIGHAFIVLKKDNQVVAATGMTGETNIQTLYHLIFNNTGLEVFMKNFRGRIEESDCVLEDINQHIKRNHYESLSYTIDKNQFKSCLDYLNNWCMKGYYRNYGLSFDACSSAGASCTSFAVSFLGVAGLLTEEQKKLGSETFSYQKNILKTKTIRWASCACFIILSLIRNGILVRISLKV